jgi:pyruvate/2-oxoglutarate/acetoin dehydrogenase E1 component
VIDTPISEANIMGAAVGMALAGLKPVVEMRVVDFALCAMDEIVNQAAKNRYMFGGQASMPVVFRSAMFYGLNTGAHHSDRPYPMFMNVPGLKIIAPSTPSDAKGLLRYAIDSDDPVLTFEACILWGSKEEVSDDEYRIPFGKARIAREGTDVTVVAISSSVPEAVAAAEAMAEEGVSVEVIDPRTLVPMDTRAILESVSKTGRLVVAEPAHRTWRQMAGHWPDRGGRHRRLGRFLHGRPARLAGGRDALDPRQLSLHGLCAAAEPETLNPVQIRHSEQHHTQNLNPSAQLKCKFNLTLCRVFWMMG